MQLLRPSHAGYLTTHLTILPVDIVYPVTARIISWAGRSANRGSVILHHMLMGRSLNWDVGSVARLHADVRAKVPYGETTGETPGHPTKPVACRPDLLDISRDEAEHFIEGRVLIRPGQFLDSGMILWSLPKWFQELSSSRRKKSL